jgi:hypothetical protein
MARTAQVSEVVEQEKTTTPEQKRAARKERIPFGVPRSKLSVYQDIPGYHLHSSHATWH